MMNEIKKTPAILFMLIVLVLDQVTKTLIRVNMELYSSIDVLGKTLRLSHVVNDGAAFSISLPNPTYNRIFFIGTSVLALGFIIYMLIKATHRIQVIAFGLVMGGAIGNLIDRIMFGHVTDFIDADFPDFIMHRWPVFNIADSAIVIAMILIVIDVVFIKDTLPEYKESNQILNINENSPEKG